jgi:hypothetical protein
VNAKLITGGNGLPLAVLGIALMTLSIAWLVVLVIGGR